MKRLIVCYDGTWNNPDQEDNGIAAPTNVVKLYNALSDSDDQGVEQLKFYHPGVGGEDSGIIDAVLGGAIGMGVSRHICSGYYWLGKNYEEGDEIYLYGFSRGAFTARSLGGMLGRGLLNLRKLKPKAAWERVHKAYSEGYRVEKAKTTDWAESDWKFFNDGKATPIHFIGVWDTVGALGVPDDLEILNFFDNKEKWEFHDTELSLKVSHARHAMAIDEKRTSFTVTRWKNASKHPDAVELWFPGAHSDVGGGYAHSDLSNGALKWMIGESDRFGLAFRPEVIPYINANSLGVIHNSYKGLFSKLRSRPRNIPAMVEANHSQFHQSAIDRQIVSPIEYPPYHVTRILEVGESVVVPVFADTRWNPTNIFLKKGHSYTFKGNGEWQDSKDTCDWKGTQNDELTRSDIVRFGASFLGKFENIFRRLSNNKSTDFLGTKRVEHIKWFRMVGAIANDKGAGKTSGQTVGHDGSATPHQYVDLTVHQTKSTALKIKQPGYLYCFPNDVWSLYENNHGSIDLTIKRVG
ncbi:DUF2235 domain-containing protein [Rubellicoccus peritrichatus]|uniref:DUF2235 domain-containing protein n=1 Tax=Rubellicoccus peritrichatus TaxID=3080537 RepID=A0AAQ3QS55_9BACT|nr:DUF2235 domain-containing protein [Puniceicoccus sp. CR14]WOO42038.1 DUF2235 domain-containing protein [Puniceicoccus sp. CR14]